MVQEIRMPSLGQTTEELRILAWLKSEGDEVKMGEPLLEVETDKATLEVESFTSGTLLRIVRGADEVVEAGAVLAYIGAPGEAVATVSEKEVAGVLLAPPTAAMVSPAPGEQPALQALPSVRRLARQHGIDLAQVSGSGRGGRIRKEDVLTFLESRAAPFRDEKETIPLSRHRQVLAQRLTRSVQTIPQITLTMTVNMSRARAFLQARRSEGLVELTYTHLIVRCVASALRQHPALNRRWLADGPCLQPLTRADVGLAIAGEDSLLVLTLPEPDRLPLLKLVEYSRDMVRRGRTGTLVAADTAPAAITVTNLGMYGVDHFAAIVDPDQTAILATGRVADHVAVIAGGLHIVPQMNMSLTVDHRVVDGVLAAQFLATVRDKLETIGEG